MAHFLKSLLLYEDRMSKSQEEEVSPFLSAKHISNLRSKEF